PLLNERCYYETPTPNRPITFAPSQFRDGLYVRVSGRLHAVVVFRSSFHGAAAMADAAVAYLFLAIVKADL
ncbi:47_t:CDS:1, partial [Paraglomus occultum]